MVFGCPNIPYHSARLSLRPGEILEFHIFLDRPVIEVFTNHGLCLTTRVYPAGSESNHIALFSEGSESRLVALDAWE